MTPIEPDPANWFSTARYGLFIHFGLYSQISRGEWAMNKEGLSPGDLRQVAAIFSPDRFDAEAIADLAVAGGMKYIIFTTMHHEGFRMYHSDLSDFNSTKTRTARDFTAEIIQAARSRGLKIGLYHSLNNWFDQPDSVAALEDATNYRIFIANTHERIRELVTRYQPVDILWYDGWWPFDANGWQSERLNEMVRKIQPGILFNGRNGLPGDFATPEQHLSAPDPWRPWEGCVTLNDNWGYHAGDRNWKSPIEVIKMLAKVAQGNGNLLLNIGPRGDGSIPEESERIIRSVGRWLKTSGECIFGTEPWSFDMYKRGSHRGDFCHHGPFTVKGNSLYLIATSLPPDKLVLTGLEANCQAVECLGHGPLTFTSNNDAVRIETRGIPVADDMPPVIRLDCDRPPSIYKTGGLRVPRCDHPHYDPVKSDIVW